jgi:hypothetical protein
MAMFSAAQAAPARRAIRPAIASRTFGRPTIGE